MNTGQPTTMDSGLSTDTNANRPTGSNAGQLVCAHCKKALNNDGTDADHLNDKKQFIDDFNKAYKGALGRNTTLYKDAYALFLRWNEDSFIDDQFCPEGVQGEIDRLDEVLRSRYRFKTETYLIPSENSQRRLHNRIHAFVSKYGNRGNLLLVYYGGHGEKNLRDQSVWVQGWGPSVNWWSIQTLLEAAAADVALILDCCFAATADETTFPLIRGTIEILAACCHDTTTPAPSDLSFTSRLCDILERTSAKPLTITALHASLMSWRAHAPWLASYSSTAGQKMLRRTPIHCIVGPGDKASIRLCISEPGYQFSPNFGQFLANLGPLDIYPPSQSSTGTQRAPAQILVAVSVTGDDHNVQDWSDWLASHMPKDVIDLRLVKAEGVYGGNSTLITVAIPVAVWNLLRYSSAYRYIGYITTPNKLTEGLEVRDSKSPSKKSELSSHLKPVAGNSNPLKTTTQVEIEK